MKCFLSNFLFFSALLWIGVEGEAFSQTQDSVRTLDSVIVTAQYSPNSPEKAVHKVKLISKEKIEAMGAQNLSDVLTNEINVRLSKDNILGNSMSMQGVSGQNVKILIDGVPVIGRLNGNIDISQINMDNVERVEIIEGPLSVSYGTDALAGTVNIITKKNQKEKFSCSSNNYYESIGQYNFSERIGYRKSNTILSLNGGRNYFDGWRTADNPFYIELSHIADSTRYKNWKPKEQYFARFYAGQYIKQLKLGYTGDYFFEIVTNRGLPRAPYSETAFDDYYKTYRLGNSLTLSGQVNQTYFTNILFAYNHFKRVKNTFYKDLTTLSKTLAGNSYDQDTTLFNAIVLRASVATTKESSKLNYEIGYDIQHETGTSLRLKDGVQQIGDYALFTSAEYKPSSKLIIRPGLRAIYSTAYNAPLAPSINFKYQLKKVYTIRFSYARGFRAPSLKELYLYFVDINHNIIGNPDLKAEYSQNFNYTMSCYKRKTKHSMKTDNTIFYNYIENMISLAQSNGAQYIYFNVEKYQTLGVQLQTELSWKNFSITVGGACIGRCNQLSEEYQSNKFTYSPEGKFNLLYKWKKPKIAIALFYKYTGEFPSFAVTAENEIYKTKISDYHMADISMSRKLWKEKINLCIGSKNIFNIKNVNGFSAGDIHSSVGNTVSIGMGRTYFFKLDINLHSKE